MQTNQLTCPLTKHQNHPKHQNTKKEEMKLQKNDAMNTIRNTKTEKNSHQIHNLKENLPRQQKKLR